MMAGKQSVFRSGLRTGSRPDGVSALRGVVTPSGPVAVLDLGSTKVSCAIAEPVDRHINGQDYRHALRTTGLGQTASRGIRNGAIASVSEVERAIRVAVDAAERMAGLTIHSVFVNVSGGRPSTLSASALVSTQTGIVSPRDIETAISIAISRADIGKRHVLHLNPSGYSLDGIASEQPPLGMHGEKLGVDVGIVTLDGAHLRNLTLAVERAHLRVAGFGLSAYAAARGVLSPDEMLLGALAIDLGGQTTGYAVVRQGVLVASGQVAVGAGHITGDMAQGLSTTLAHAERLKNLFGSVVPFAHEDREMLAVPLLGERGVDSIQQVPKQVLTSIIAPRLEETFELIQRELDRNPLPFPVSRVVLTGGGSQLQGVREFAAQFFGCTVRLGKPMLAPGAVELAKGPDMAVSAGLFALAIKPDRRLAMPAAARSHIEQRQMGYVRRVGRWLKEAL